MILVGRIDDERLDARVQEIRSRGFSANPAVADATAPDAVAALYKQVFRDHKGLDILVAAAGALGDARLGMISEELLTSTIDVNLTGTVRHMQGAARLMQRRTSGSIVVIGSIMGLRGNAGQVPYAAAKAGLVGAVLSAAKELGPLGIRCNLVAPGFIETRMVADLDPEIRRQRVDAVSLGRAGTAQEVADVVAFLASDAAAYVTAQVIGVDGGMIA